MLILGDMLELGENSAEYHLELAHMIKATPARVVVLVGHEIAHTAAALATEQRSIYHVANRDELMQLLPQVLRDDDLVLLKSSHSVGLSGLFSATKG